MSKPPNPIPDTHVPLSQYKNVWLGITLWSTLFCSLLYLTAGILALWPLRKSKAAFVIPPSLLFFGSLVGFICGSMLAFIVAGVYDQANLEMPGYIALVYGLMVAFFMGSSAFSSWTSIL